MSLQLILSDNTAIDIVESGLSGHVIIQCEDQAAFDAVWAQLTPEAVADYTIVKDGVTMQTVTNATLSGTQTVTNPDNSLTGHFYLTGTTVEQVDEYATVGRILMGEEE